LIYSVLLPVLDTVDQIVYCLVQKIPIHRIVGFLENALSGFYSSREVGFRRFVFTLFEEVLLGVRRG